MMKNPLGVSRVESTSGKDSLIQSSPGVVEVFSKGMINSILLARAGPGCCWAEESGVTANAAKNSNERTIPAGFLKVSKL
jgi:hypothetical protein